MDTMQHAGATMFLVEAWERRLTKGARWCRDKKIGPLRRALKSPPATRPAAVIAAGGIIDPQAAYRDARELLALHCRICGACELAKDPP